MTRYLATALLIASLAGAVRAGDNRERSRARNRTRTKLRKIVIPKLCLDDVPVSVAFQLLKQRSRELDPDGEGVNFVLILKPTPQTRRAAAARK